jgi:hypothetical protein
VFHSFQRTSTGKAPVDLFQSPPFTNAAELFKQQSPAPSLADLRRQPLSAPSPALALRPAALPPCHQAGALGGSPGASSGGGGAARTRLQLPCACSSRRPLPRLPPPGVEAIRGARWGGGPPRRPARAVPAPELGGVASAPWAQGARPRRCGWMRALSSCGLPQGVPRQLQSASRLTFSFSRCLHIVF